MVNVLGPGLVPSAPQNLHSRERFWGSKGSTSEDALPKIVCKPCLDRLAGSQRQTSQMTIIKCVSAQVLLGKVNVRVLCLDN